MRIRILAPNFLHLDPDPRGEGTQTNQMKFLKMIKIMADLYDTYKKVQWMGGWMDGRVV